ncbi:MAG: prepilin-type N-terminal cleavage/methylation domain-containing protein [Gemmatimonadaceae bacterium]|nr:prepilin-type N-terminal cleavage/methylation domain-containing protein [Gemmatimonadaceae bacterium]NUQ93715.1 prepilin-type N-terminal cleavage/methylation domain-containing protein [Gemmatimonadaceae bacterium]NUR34203.1 prepilin-type N-terminal cleavage/methylation domain-containing protein [Gemmatimonadaceae bacterium]
MSGRRGVTLAELMVVIVILGVMAAVTGVAFARKAPVPVTDARVAAVARARTAAIAGGRDSTLRIETDSGPWLVTVRPDGRVVTVAPLGIDPLSGRRDDAR